MRQPIHWVPPDEPEPEISPALFEALVDAWVRLLLDDLALDKAQAKLQGGVDAQGDATAS